MTNEEEFHKYPNNDSLIEDIKMPEQDNLTQEKDITETLIDRGERVKDSLNTTNKDELDVDKSMSIYLKWENDISNEIAQLMESVNQKKDLDVQEAILDRLRTIIKDLDQTNTSIVNELKIEFNKLENKIVSNQNELNHVKDPIYSGGYDPRYIEDLDHEKEKHNEQKNKVGNSLLRQFDNIIGHTNVLLGFAIDDLNKSGTGEYKEKLELREKNESYFS